MHCCYSAASLSKQSNKDIKLLSCCPVSEACGSRPNEGSLSTAHHSFDSSTDEKHLSTFESELQLQDTCSLPLLPAVFISKRTVAFYQQCVNATEKKLLSFCPPSVAVPTNSVYRPSTCCDDIRLQ